jgi:HEAT repeat protein
VIEDLDEELEVRRRAVEAVAGLPGPGVEELIRDAYESGEAELKQSSIYAMGRSSNPAWLPTVLREMDDRSPPIRYEAANAAGLLGDETVAPHLISLLRDDDMSVQLAAISSLGSVGGALAGQALRKCLESDDEAIEEAADEALREIEFDDDPLSLTFDV